MLIGVCLSGVPLPTSPPPPPAGLNCQVQRVNSLLVFSLPLSFSFQLFRGCWQAPLLNALTSAPPPGSLNCGAGKSEQARGGGGAAGEREEEEEVVPVG